jgi:hypothetical protein
MAASRTIVCQKKKKKRADRRDAWVPRERWRERWR